MLVLELLAQQKVKSFHRLVSINCCKNSASIKVGQFTIYKFPFQKNFLSMEKFSSWEKLDLPNLEKSYELLWFLTNFGKWRIKIKEGLIWCLTLLLFFSWRLSFEEKQMANFDGKVCIYEEWSVNLQNGAFSIYYLKCIFYAFYTQTWLKWTLKYFFLNSVAILILLFLWKMSFKTLSTVKPHLTRSILYKSYSRQYE